MCSIKYFLWLVLFNVVECRVVYTEHSELNTDELSFMKKFGYLPNEPGSEIGFVYTPHSLSQAVTRLQYFAGLPQTGELDKATRRLFKSRRCGNKDIEESPYRRKRYTIQTPWDKKDITYNIVNGSRTMSRSRVVQLMETGLAMWAAHGDLTFTSLDSEQADIKVMFMSGEHGDGSAFDGVGRVVAHAFPPPHGAMHFDDDETWGENLEEQDDEDDVTDFLAVAVHEIGHALGLAHSTVKSSVMFPYYQVPFQGLGEDDIEGMRELYLKDSPRPPPPLAITVSTSSPPSPRTARPPRTSLAPRFTKPDDDDDIPHLCYTNYDTIQVLYGKICVFEEEWMWMLSNKKEIVPGFPRRFHDVFKGLPSQVTSIKAIYQNRKNRVVIFHGRKFWEFNSTFNLVKTGRIKKFEIPKYVHDLTTVFLSNYNNKTYLMAYERFWRYDEDNSRVDPGYPKSMSAWRNISYPVDAAIVWEGDTYMFRGPRFWRFDNSVVAAQEYYPVPTAQVWFPCPEDNEMDLFFVNED